MNRDALAKDIPVANLRARDAALPLQVLRLQSKACGGENFIPLPQSRVTVNDDVRMKLVAVTENNVLTEDTVRADLATAADLRLGMDDGRGMDLAHDFKHPPA